MRSGKKSGLGSISELIPEELEAAENIWLQRCQLESFPEEIDCLTKGKPIPSGSRLKSLSPYLDDNGVMKIKGRLDRGKLGANVKRPVLLDP